MQKKFNFLSFSSKFLSRLFQYNRVPSFLQLSLWMKICCNVCISKGLISSVDSHSGFETRLCSFMLCHNHINLSKGICAHRSVNTNYERFPPLSSNSFSNKTTKSSNVSVILSFWSSCKSQVDTLGLVAHIKFTGGDKGSNWANLSSCKAKQGFPKCGVGAVCGPGNDFVATIQ